MVSSNLLFHNPQYAAARLVEEECTYDNLTFSFFSFRTWKRFSSYAL